MIVVRTEAVVCVRVFQVFFIFRILPLGLSVSDAQILLATRGEPTSSQKSPCFYLISTCSAHHSRPPTSGALRISSR
uniref:Putative secreted protein n=1 Tax=Anopheles darlingi TaxID=43151 RepID=A0A2M4DJB1_ANODA